jgi:hypothetical protein
VVALGVGQPLEAAAVELDAVDVLGDVAVLGAVEVEPAARLVQRVDASHLPAPVGQLLDELAVGRVVVDVQPARALAAPEERAVLEPARVVVEGFDPRLGRLAEEARGLARRGVGGV